MSIKAKNNVGGQQQGGWVRGERPERNKLAEALDARKPGPKIGTHRSWYEVSVTNEGVKRSNGINVWRDIGGNLFGPSAYRPSEGNRRMLLRQELSRKDFSPSQTRQRLLNTAAALRNDPVDAMRHKPVDKLLQIFTSPLSFPGELGQMGLEHLESALGYQHERRTDPLHTQIGPRWTMERSHDLGPLGQLQQRLSAGSDIEAKGNAGISWGRAGVKADAEGHFRAGPMAEHHAKMKLGELGKVSMTNTARSDLQAQAQGSVKAGVAGLRAKGEASAQVGPALSSNGNFKHDLLDLGYGSNIGVGAKGNVAGNASLGLNGLRAVVDANGSVGGDAGVSGKAKTMLGEVGGGAEGEVNAYAKGYGDVAADLSGVEGDVGLGAGVQAEVEGRVAIRSAGVNLGGEKLDVNGMVRGHAEATAQANGRVTAGLKAYPPRASVDVGGNAFAGAKAEVEGQVGLGGFMKVRAKGGAWAGAGARGKLAVGFNDGKLRIGLGAGLCLGYGAGGNAAVEVDFKKMANAGIGTAVDAVKRSVRYAKDPKEAIKDAKKLVTSVPKKISKTVKSVEKTATSAVKAAKKGLKSLAKKIFG